MATLDQGFPEVNKRLLTSRYGFIRGITVLPSKDGLTAANIARSCTGISHYLRHGTQRVVDLRKPQQSREKQRSGQGQEKLSREEVLRRRHSTPVLRHAEHAEKESQGDRGDRKRVHKVPRVVEEVPVGKSVSPRRSKAREGIHAPTRRNT